MGADVQTSSMKRRDGWTLEEEQQFNQFQEEQRKKRNKDMLDKEAADRAAVEAAKKEKELQAAQAQETERQLAPLRKALTDEVDFLGKKYSLMSKTGGRGLF